MLSSSSRYCREAFLSSNRIFIDSDVLITIAADRQLYDEFTELSKTYSVVFSSISMIEVGIGPADKVRIEETNRADDLYDLAAQHPIDNNYMWLSKIANISLPGMFCYNPNHHEWYAARRLLLKLISKAGKKDKNAQESANDALIFQCAWNSRSALITNNTRHFVQLNALQTPLKTNDGQLRHVPIFTLEEFLNNSETDVSYPENLPENLRLSYGW